MYEQLAYDDEGQLLTGTLMDYTIPTAVEMPRFEIAHQETPSPFTPLGMKGRGRVRSGRVPRCAVQRDRECLRRARPEDRRSDPHARKGLAGAAGRWGGGGGAGVITKEIEFLRPATVAEALQVLAERGDDVTVLSGGMSLMPMMNLGIVKPGIVMSLNHVEGLRDITFDGDALAIGGMVRPPTRRHGRPRRRARTDARRGSPDRGRRAGAQPRHHRRKHLPRRPLGRLPPRARRLGRRASWSPEPDRSGGSRRASSSST